MASNGLEGPQIQPKPPHFILVPLMAQGHVIPMVDLARLLAAAGAQVTLIASPVNTARIRPLIDRIERSALPIHFVDLCFPTAEAGLPDGCENLDLIPSRDLFKPFIEALPLLRPQLELYLSATPPDCIIFDSINSWAAAAAKDLEIPHLIFHGPSCFYMLCYFLLEKSQVLKTIAGDFDPFFIPGLPEPVEVMKAQVTLWTDAPGWEKIREDFLAAQESAHGIVINTFEDLELSVLEKYRKETGKKLIPDSGLASSSFAETPRDIASAPKTLGLHPPTPAPTRPHSHLSLSIDSATLATSSSPHCLRKSHRLKATLDCLLLNSSPSFGILHLCRSASIDSGSDNHRKQP